MQQGQAGLWWTLVAGAIVGAVLDGNWLWLHWACKPAATLMLLWWVWRGTGSGLGYRRWVAAGLWLSSLGDVLLMLPADLFVPGLVAFLLAHLCYIRAFAPGLQGRWLLAAALPMGLFAAVNQLGLWPILPADMRVPVAVYVTVIASMAAVALAQWAARRRDADGRARALAAAGALLFLASDALLAWDRFAGNVPWAIVWVLLSYWLAQRCIAASATRAAAAMPAGSSAGVQ